MSTETPLTDADVSRLVALADAATPGPWEPKTLGEKGGWANPDLRIFVSAEIDGVAGCHVEQDAAFIAAANPATIKALSARLDALHAENQRLQGMLDPGAYYANLVAERDAYRDQSDEDQKRRGVLVIELEKAEAERDALRDAITALADEWHPVYRYHADNLRALLSEAGECRE